MRTFAYFNATSTCTKFPFRKHVFNNKKYKIFACGAKKSTILKGLVQDVFFKQFWSVLVSRDPKMFWRGLTGPEMTFWDDFC